MYCKLVNFILICCLVTVPIIVSAQGYDDGTDDGVPVDGGLSLLVAAGAGYGIKKLKEKRKL